MEPATTPNPDPTARKPPSPPRRIAVSLRMFVAILVLLGVGSALWIGVPAYRQRMAIREIERLGGEIVYQRPVGPGWLRKVVGHENWTAFDIVESVQFRPSRETFSKRYGDFPVSFPNNQQPWTEIGVEVDDSSLASIRRLSKLKECDLSCTNVGDAGIVHVATLDDLEVLNIYSTDVSDASIPLLKRLTKLKELHLAWTKVTESGIADLRRALPGLEVHE